MKTQNQIQRLVFGTAGILLGVVFFSAAVHAGLSHPPLLIYGSLRTHAEAAVASGQMKWVFTPVEGGSDVILYTPVQERSEHCNFVVRCDVESQPLSDSSRVLALRGSYSVRVFHNETEIDGSMLEETLSPLSNSLIGPLDLRLSPTGPIVRTSADIAFGALRVGQFADRSFIVANDGAGVLTGQVVLETGNHFRLVVDGFTVSSIPLSLAAGASRELTLRFQPIHAAPGLMDVLKVTTNAGEVIRLLTGDGVMIDPTATATPLHSPTPTFTPSPTVTPSPTTTPVPTVTPTETSVPTTTATATPSITPTPSPTPVSILPEIDIDCDGFISAEDLLVFMNWWHQESQDSPVLDFNEDGVIDWQDIMAFSPFWTPPAVIHALAVTETTDAWEIQLVGELPGSNYCEIHEGSVSYQVVEKQSIGDIPLRNEPQREFILSLFFTFRLRECGCDSDQPKKSRFIFAEGDPTPVDLVVAIPKPLPQGHYRIQVLANGTIQKPHAEMEVVE